ncbi:MarR family winged helix-turn-helix transcriptional regulator [Cryptosporangium phraense]|uniref:Winged helix-turn-helix transcriptional regulator n=1 Tax=Cryptosporangium phraense TaxID=2593070 RepID=A0A545AYS3_9ACTN|nr:MarR family winged helix-turn-helix transcriptional regulator [Cryptosporangium phraense]TQS46486.1 winged helix-turn-helix transcriptional regulator [Cryptosporangium phraense]
MPRPDLAAMLGPLGRRLLALERPILAAHGVSMWGYAVLLRLADEPVRAQAALAESIGADKTRLIPVLDELQAAGLIERTPDPADRRARVLSITAAGRSLRDAVQTEIQAQEERYLAVLPPDQREAFLTALRTLAGFTG